MAKKFLGRDKELKLLLSQSEKPTASFIVFRGRRRIGKSTLIKHFAKDYKFFAFEGLSPTDKTTLQAELNAFARQLSEQTGLPEVFADDWSKLFRLLWEKSQEGRVVILFDEISWMGSKDPQFLGKIKMAWDNYFSQNSQLMLIVCGSASSWIQKNILSSTGFVGRISQTITLGELPIDIVSQFWNDKNISKYEMLKVLSVTGGIPKYLEEIDPKLSAEENIKNLCFSPGGFLVDEFERIFSDLFLHDTVIYRKIVEILSNGPRTMSEIAVEAEFSRSGRLSTYLEELELGGFVGHDYSWNFNGAKETKIGLYRLKDNYLRFYMKYIAPNINKIRSESYLFQSLANLPGWNAILGLQFENLVINNRLCVKEVLGLSHDDILCDNPYMQRKTATQAGCQIDYLIQAKFGTLYVCEIKFSEGPIGLEVARQIQEKIQHLKVPKHMSFRPVLIHVNGVTDDVKYSPYFYKIIDFAEFLK